MPFVNLPGVDLWFEDTGGSGTPVIFLHAASGTCDSWVHQLPAFTTAGYRCITYDRRTWGRSRASDANGQPGFVGDDLHGLVEHLGLERFHLVATAAGGITALDYALDHPERVLSLVAANTIGGVQDPEYLEVQTRLRPAEIQELPVNLRELGPSYRGTDPGRRSTVAGNRTGKSAVRDVALATGARADHLFAAGTMRVPTLILSGEADLLSPPALMRMLAAHIPTSRFASLADAGHGAFWERPQVWNGLVLEFIGQH